MCEFARREGSEYYCRLALVAPQKRKGNLNCEPDYEQQAQCGNLKNQGISDSYIHRRANRGSMPGSLSQFTSLSKGASQGSTSTTRSPERILIDREEKNDFTY